VEEIKSWFHTNILMTNREQTAAMSLHTRSNRNVLKPAQLFHSIVTAYQSEPKFLGINISEDTKWDVHIQ
jgi:hypothetical protein